MATPFQIDPTRTTVLRRKFEQEAGRRFAKLAEAIRKAVVQQDVLGLSSNAVATGLNPGQFRFDRDPQKVAAFMEWLDRMEREHILETQPGVPLTTAAQTAWTQKYIQTAYRKGMATAASNVRKAGAQVADDYVASSFNKPIHADKVGLIYIRAYSALKGVTAEMDKQISGILASGIAAGENPKVIAKDMADRVAKIGKTRAKVIARTEVISAHAEGALNSYKEAQIEGVHADVEFSTAGDSRVCSQCKSLNGREYTVEGARGVIPVHPNCRCSWLPVIKDAPGVRL